MKKHNMKGSKPLSILYLCMSIFVLLIMVVSIILILKIDGPDIGFIIVAISCGIMTITFSISSFKIYKIIKLQELALLGKKSKGKVINLYLEHYKSEGYIVETEYEIESGEKMIIETEINPKNAKYFQIGKTIPIYINKDYAYYKIDEVISFMDEKEDSNADDTAMKKCVYCDSLNKKDALTCEHCGAKF